MGEIIKAKHGDTVIFPLSIMRQESTIWGRADILYGETVEIFFFPKEPTKQTPIKEAIARTNITHEDIGIRDALFLEIWDADDYNRYEEPTESVTLIEDTQEYLSNEEDDEEEKETLPEVPAFGPASVVNGNGQDISTLS